MSNDKPRSALAVENVRKDYPSPAGPVTVLAGVSLALSAGHSMAIVGPSGSGKSTLLNIIGSLDKPTAGDVRLDDLDVPSLDGRALADYRSKKVGFVFQDHHLLPQCTALENVLLPTVAARGGDSSDAAKSLLERVGIAERMYALPAKLSGGERQRVAIARALINRPALLLCDEPTGNLDRETASRVADLFVELVVEHNVILIGVTHDLEFAKRFERTMRLREGKLTE